LDDPLISIPSPDQDRNLAAMTHHRLVILEPSLREEALRDPWTGQLLVTDVGAFPRAVGHRRERPEGAQELILMVCAAGHGWAELDGHARTMGPGSVAVLPAGQPHAYGASVEDPWSLWWLHLTGTQIGLAQGPGGWLRGGVFDHPEPRALVRAIGQVLAGLEHGQDARRRAAATTAAWSVLGLLHALTAPPEDPGVAMALQALHTHLNRPFSVAGLARIGGGSPSHFTARFRTATGQSPIDYLLRLRMERAAWLLQNGDQAIEAIARQVGYEDPAYFSRRFTRHHGCPPRAYRGR